MDDHHFDVFTALHDDVKLGGDYPRIRSRVVISSRAFPSSSRAAEMACQLAVSVHGGMAIACLQRI
jgi:hypothetical protein